MKQVLIVLSAVLLAFAWSAGSAVAQDAEYVGSRSCGKCHRKAEDGEQYGIWQKSEHAEAFEVLGSDEAKEAAQRVGVSGNPQEAEACLVCHTTGWGEPEDKFGRRFDMEAGVQCEACHGAGSEYDSKRTMQQITEERAGGGESATAKKTGLVFPDENTCKECHQKSITVDGNTFENPEYEPFNYDEYWEKIKHPIPE